MIYASPAAFRQALEARLQSRTRESAVPLDRLRRRVVFERLLARLAREEDQRWVLKGGMALELRWHDRARATKDIDFVVRAPNADGDTVREELIVNLRDDRDGDWFEFRVGEPTPIAPDEAGRAGWRFGVEARLAGREFSRVRVDVVPRKEELFGTECLSMPSLLDFAGLPAPVILVVDRRQHFAEKLHAMTRSYGDRINTRVRDLPDLLMLIHDGLAPDQDLRRAVDHVFATRATHEVPIHLTEPPASWNTEYHRFATDLELPELTLEAAMMTLRAFWSQTTLSPEVP